MPRSSLYEEGMDSKELDEKWIEVYERDMGNADSFYTVQRVKYILVGIVIGLSINVMEAVARRKEGLKVDERYLEENQAAYPEGSGAN